MHIIHKQLFVTSSNLVLCQSWEFALRVWHMCHFVVSPTNVCMSVCMCIFMYKHICMSVCIIEFPFLLKYILSLKFKQPSTKIVRVLWARIQISLKIWILVSWYTCRKTFPKRQRWQKTLYAQNIFLDKMSINRTEWRR